MDQVQLGEMEIDVCPACRGIWFDAEELMKAVKLDEAELAKMGDSAPTEPAGDQGWSQEPAFCPRCSVALRQHRLVHDLAIMVDSCPAGHGVWLDKGEFPAIRSFFGAALERIAEHTDPLPAGSAGSMGLMPETGAETGKGPLGVQDPDVLLGRLLCATVQADAGYVHDVMDINKTMEYNIEMDIGTGNSHIKIKPGSEAYDIKYNISHVKKKPFKWSS